MNLIKTGTTVRVFDDSVGLLSELPKGSFWTAETAPMAGPYLQEAPAAEAPGHKVYGPHEERIKKVVAAYEARKDGNTGVILSGAKGIGKTLFTRMLMHGMAERGYPVLTVGKYFPGLADFLGSLTQDMVVVFDEFDKNFDINDERAKDQTALQNELLGLFDGVTRGHKLYVITCNDINKLSKFYLNRPGRFRYHLRFQYPNMDEVRQYLKDRVPGVSDEEAATVAKFTRLVPLSYDCLSAIADELLLGETFRSAMETLNIVRVGMDGEDAAYSVDAVFEYRGQKFTRMVSYNCKLDLFAESTTYIEHFHVSLGYVVPPGMTKDDLMSNDLDLGQIHLWPRAALDAATVTDAGEIMVPAGAGLKFRRDSGYTADEDDSADTKRRIAATNALLTEVKLVGVKLTPNRSSGSVHFSKLAL